MESPHRTRRHSLVWLFATLLLASCAARPPARDADDSIRDMRAGYLSAHPYGRFNDSIRSGKVAVGMNFDDVLASWGIPDTRIRDTNRSEEHWVYVLTDRWNGDSVSYEFVFVNRELTSWESMRNVASSQYLYNRDAASRAASGPDLPDPARVSGSGAPLR